MLCAAGKSSLLAAILGELQGVAGRARVRGCLSYAPQAPWLLSSTLRCAACRLRVAACAGVFQMHVHHVLEGCGSTVSWQAVEVHAVWLLSPVQKCLQDQLWSLVFLEGTARPAQTDGDHNVGLGGHGSRV